MGCILESIVNLDVCTFRNIIEEPVMCLLMVLLTVCPVVNNMLLLFKFCEVYCGFRKFPLRH